MPGLQHYILRSPWGFEDRIVYWECSDRHASADYVERWGHHWIPSHAAPIEAKPYSPTGRAPYPDRPYVMLYVKYAFCGKLTPRGAYCALKPGHGSRGKATIPTRHALKARTQRYRNAPANREKLTAYHKAYRDRRGKQADEYKLARGCAECGYGKNGSAEQTCALDFDHPDPLLKVAEISTMVYSPVRYPDAVFLAEMDRCVVLCKNCHAIKTKRNKDRAKGVQRVAAERRAA